MRAAAFVGRRVAGIGQRDERERREQDAGRRRAGEQRAPCEVRDEQAARDRRERAAEQQHDEECARRGRAILRREADLDQDPARAHHGADEIALKAARERELQRRVGRRRGHRAKREHQHAAGDVTPVTEPVDPPLLLQDAEHGRHRVSARRPHELVRRRVDFARDVAREERERGVVEVIEAGDDREHPWKEIAAQVRGAPERRSARRGTHALVPPVLRARAAARRCAISSSGFSPASRRST